MLPKQEKTTKFMSILDLSKQSTSEKYSYENSKYDNDAKGHTFYPYQTSAAFGFNYKTNENKPRVLDLSLSSKKNSSSPAFNNYDCGSCSSSSSSTSSRSPPLQSPTIAASGTYQAIFKTDNIISNSDTKTEEYYERRRKNNISAKKSRDMKKKREVEQREKLHNLEEENRKLKQKLAYCVCHKLRFYSPCASMPLAVDFRNREYVN